MKTHCMKTRLMKFRHAYLVCLVFCLGSGLIACSTAPVIQHPNNLFHDELFPPATVRINADDVLAISDEMKHYLRNDIAKQLKSMGLQSGLFDALYRKGQLRLEYDAELTRTAAETFTARSGNCLSLVIMTAALAKELDLRVHYQRVIIAENWSRNNDIFFSNGHVNLTLGTYHGTARSSSDNFQRMTIDFFPPEEMRGQRSQEINEQTIIAMYMNNRAAESLARGKVADAYWWVRESIRQQPAFLPAYNTLGVVYRRHGHLREAELVLSQALLAEPENVPTLSNLALVLRGQDRLDEAALLTAKLEKLQPYPPYYFFNLGQVAMQRGDFNTAKTLFSKEVKRAEYNPEFQFWLAVAYFKLNDSEQAKKHMSFAMERSTTRKDHELYAAKLDRLRSYQR